MNYDANGNLINDSTGRQFTWNALDQLTQLKTPDTTASFAYDPLGRRTSYTKASTLKTYLLNGLDVLSDGSSNFLHGVGIDEHLQVDSPTGSMNYLNDHLGSTSQLIDSSNALSKARLDYKSYGKLEGDVSNPIAANPYTYTGREDDGTGLYYYRNRYYDPELEVFISQDPLGDAQRYVKENPLSYVDPSGNYALVDDITFMAGGALLGVGGQVAADLITGKMSSDNDYRAAYIGGAASGEALLYFGPVASGAAGGFATSASKQVLNGNLSDFNWNNAAQASLIGGILGKFPGVKIGGITAGQGNYNAIYKQMVTKFGTDSISKVSSSTAQKMFIGRATATGMLPGNILGSILGNMSGGNSPCSH